MSETLTKPEMSLEEKIEFLALKIRKTMHEGSEPGTATDGAELVGMNLLKDRAKRMKMVSMAYDILKPVLDELDKEYDRLRKSVIPDLMQENDVRTVTLEGIGRVQLAADCYASIPAEQQPAAFAWLRANKYGDLIKETVHSATLKAWAKEMIEQGRTGAAEEAPEVDEAAASVLASPEPTKGPEKLPEGVFKIEPFTRASIVKVAGKKAAK